MPPGEGHELTWCVCVCVCVWELLLHRHWLYPVVLLAGVDTTSGPPHLLLVPTDRVLVVLQKGA